MIEAAHPVLSVRRQCRLLGLARSGLYYEAQGESAENLELMRLLDEAYTVWPFYGVRKMTAHLKREGYAVNPKRVRRLMRRMGLEAIYPRPKRGLSVPQEGAKTYPYLLRDVAVVRPDQVWSADITYLRLRQGFLYLVALLDWYSRRSSTRTRASSSRARASRDSWRGAGSRSAWTGAGGCSTTSSRNGCGGRSSTRRCT